MYCADAVGFWVWSRMQPDSQTAYTDRQHTDRHATRQRDADGHESPVSSSQLLTDCCVPGTGHC